MKNHKTTHILGIAGMGIACVLINWLFFQLHAADGQTRDILLIGNHTLAESTLSPIDVQNIFLGKKKKLDSLNITFVILKSGYVHEQFLQEFLSRTPSQYTKYWKKMVFTGRGKAPKVFKTEQELLEYVKTTENTIGYVSADTWQTIGSNGMYQFVIE